MLTSRGRKIDEGPSRGIASRKKWYESTIDNKVIYLDKDETV